MIDVQLYGTNPRGHHLTNVFIHTFSTLLLLFLLLRITGEFWCSFFVAALFALHPLHVESVAWVAERKDILSAFFWFLTLLLYANYTATRKTSLYILTFFSFIVGLMSKPMLVTLPIIMLLMDFWPLDRYRLEEMESGLRHFIVKTLSLVKEKIPFFACSLFSGIVTIYAQYEGGSISSIEITSFSSRIENALTSYLEYISLTLWPHDLAVLYPFPASIPLWRVISSLFVLLLVSGITIRVRRMYPYLAVGWFWFLFTLVPVIGLIQVGQQTMADRYTYIPLTGLFIMIAWGIKDLTKGLPHRKSIVAVLAATVITTFAALTWLQIGYWRDSISLFRHTLQVTSGNGAIHYNLGLTYKRKGDLAAAVQEFKASLMINPSDKYIHFWLGTVYAQQNDLDAAIREYQEALQIDADFKEAHKNLGATLGIHGNMDGAIHEFQEVLRIAPNDSEGHSGLGLALLSKGNLAAAIQEYQEALRINPKNVKADTGLQLALAKKTESIKR
jgi:cytochrome c-type biogenesis protein CcmH/NrfG